MNVCPYTDDIANCSLPSTDADVTMTFCKQCSQFAFQCADGHWNRAFARYCTQCRQKLEKPAQWGMASGNPQRTATLPQKVSVDSLNHSGFGTWVANIPEIEPGDNLPGLLAIDGFIVVPNPRKKKLDVYNIIYDSDQRNLNLKWSIPFSEKLTYGSTPIYHGLHLYTVVSGGIQKTSVINGKTDLINNINGVEASQIKPLPGCAPLKCEVNGKPMLIAGLEHGVLLYGFKDKDGVYFDYKLFKENMVLSPVQCGEYVVFTSLQGQILTLDINILNNEVSPKIFRDISFSAPVSIGENVYFETLQGNGNRSLARFNPKYGKLSKAIDIDDIPKHDFEKRQSIFKYPPLTDGKRMFFTDRAGEKIYTYDSEHGPLPIKVLPKNDKIQFSPLLSIVLNRRIYSTTSYGMTILDIEQSFHADFEPLGTGTIPNPVTRPIRYGDKLFILCKDRLMCRDY